MGYVKIHDQLFTSSIIEEDIVVRWVWIAMLLSCDRNGNVYGTIPALARKANVRVKEFAGAMELLMSPDEHSTSKEEGGRRMVETGSNLYHCVNYLHYRGMKDPVEEREKTRERVAKHRKKKAGNGGNKNVTKCNDIAEAEAEAEAEADTSHAHPAGPDELFESFWTLYPRKVAKKRAAQAWHNMTIQNREKALAALPLHINHYWQGKDAKFIPHPTTWLNQERWADEIAVSEGCDPDADQWMFDTYRVEDRDAHCRDEMWAEYIGAAAFHPPRKAPTFDEWMKKREDW